MPFLQAQRIGALSAVALRLLAGSSLLGHTGLRVDPVQFSCDGFGFRLLAREGGWSSSRT
jgi:hypothetical protein